MTRNVSKIIVPIKDPTAKPPPALSKAVQIAAATGAKLEIFHAIDTPVYVASVAGAALGTQDLQSTGRGNFVDALDALAERVRADGVEITTSAEWDYPAHEAILRRARRTKADLIVASCHPGRHIAPWLLRLTDWDLLRESPIPVLLVKNAKAYDAPPVVAAVDPAHAFSKPSRLDDDILEEGAAIADALGGKLFAMYAYAPMPVGAVTPGVYTPDFAAETSRRSSAAARKGLARLAARLSIPTTRQRLIARHPVDAIQIVARETKCQIVVMGAISRSGLKRIFIGNTAEQVLDALACDVLVVKPRRFETRIAARPRGMRVIAAPEARPPRAPSDRVYPGRRTARR
jgi:universal stress protein E